MAKVSAFLAPGLEEVECLAVVDVLRRAGVCVDLVSISEDRCVTGSHGICIVADTLLGETDFEDTDCLFLPGGMPGTENLYACGPVCALLRRFAAEGKRIAAICAAPSVPGRLGLLEGRRATCYPGREAQLQGAEATGEGVVTDGPFTTARGLGFAIDLGLELAALLVSPEKAQAVKAVIQHPDCVN